MDALNDITIGMTAEKTMKPYPAKRSRLCIFVIPSNDWLLSHLCELEIIRSFAIQRRTQPYSVFSHSRDPGPCSPWLLPLLS